MRRSALACEKKVGRSSDGCGTSAAWPQSMVRPSSRGGVPDLAGRAGVLLKPELLLVREVLDLSAVVRVGAAQGPRRFAPIHTVRIRVSLNFVHVLGHVA